MELVDRILGAAQRKGWRLVIDARYNGGGDNTTYGPLLELLQSGDLRERGKVAVLVGRMTFSAAGNFVASVDHETSATLVGEVGERAVRPTSGATGSRSSCLAPASPHTSRPSGSRSLPATRASPSSRT